MASDRTAGFAGEGLDFVTQLTDLWTETAARWVGALAPLAGDASLVPGPRAWAEASFDAAEQLLRVQRELVLGAFDRLRL